MAHTVYNSVITSKTVSDICSPVSKKNNVFVSLTYGLLWTKNERTVFIICMELKLLENFDYIKTIFIIFGYQNLVHIYMRRVFQKTHFLRKK